MSNEVGKPAKLTAEKGESFAPQVLHKLESAFLRGMNNREACFLADISESLFYRVCQTSPELLERFKMLQENVKVRAKEVVAEAIDKGDKQQANWYLERKAKDEFSTRNELTGANGKDLHEGLTEEQKQKLDALLDEQTIPTSSNERNAGGESVPVQ